MPKPPRRAASGQPFHHRPEPYPTSANGPLTPSIPDQRASASAWSDSDDRTLIEARREGLAWLPIAKKHFPTKTANACRKRHERLAERKRAEALGSNNEEALAEAYVEVREEMWKILASKLNGASWKMVEEKCMAKGLKNLMSASRNAQRRSKSDPSGDGNDSDHDNANDDSGIGGMDTEPPDENGPSSSMAPMQPQGHAPSSSPPPPPPPPTYHDHSAGAGYKAYINKPSNYPQSATAPSQAPFRQSVGMPSIASILQPFSVRSF